MRPLPSLIVPIVVHRGVKKSMRVIVPTQQRNALRSTGASACVRLGSVEDAAAGVGQRVPLCVSACVRATATSICLIHEPVLYHVDVFGGGVEDMCSMSPGPSPPPRVAVAAYEIRCCSCCVAAAPAGGFHPLRTRFCSSSRFSRLR